MQTLRIPALALAAVVLLVGACAQAAGSPGPSGPGASPLTLAGSSWRLVSIDGRQPPVARPMTVRFTADRVTGDGGCNEFGGAFSVDSASGTLAIGDLVSTKRACVDPAANDLEQAYLAALDRVTSAVLDATGRLVLAGGGATLIFGRTR